jgi:hypothetical protein
MYVGHNNRSWIVGMCSVLFDVDVGPRVSNMVPDDGILSKEEKHDVAFHAFPVRHVAMIYGDFPVRACCVRIFHDIFVLSGLDVFGASCQDNDKRQVIT